MLLNELEVRLYLTRIGVEHSFKQCELPSFERLAELQQSHLSTVPFENLSIILNHPMALAEKHAFEKIVIENHGGFCYELNYAFYQLLVSLRYDVSLISASVYNDENQCFGPPHDHLALLVNLYGHQYLVDVGFGDSFIVPVELSEGVSTQAQADYYIKRENTTYYLQQRKANNEWKTQYKFTISPQRIDDFQHMFEYHQTNPDSIFTQKSICTMLTSYGRVTLSNGVLKRTEYGEVSEIPLTQEVQVTQVLAREFGIYLPKASPLNCLLNVKVETNK